MATTITQNDRTVNWRQVGAFLVLNFALSWGLCLVLYLSGGLFNPAAGTLLQLLMLLPAFSAILLSLFFFKDHPLYYRQAGEDEYPRRPRWFFIIFLVYTLLYIVLGALSLAFPERVAQIAPFTGIATIIVLLLLIGIRLASGREAFARAGLSGGKAKDWLLWGLFFVVFYGIQIGLNALLGLGQQADLQALTEALGVEMSGPALLALLALQTVVIGSLIAIPISFGEEYGWRGYLQSALVKMGKKRGILLLGIIWGIWHYPVILMGHNYPGRPLLGVVLMTIYTIGLAFILGHIVFKTGSVLLAAFLHGLNNQVLAYYFTFINTPRDTAFSFGIGIYGLLLMAPVVFVLLRDPIWNDEAVEAESIKQLVV